MKKIKWSSQAIYTYNKTIENILLNWNDDVAKSFVLDVDALLLKLVDYNNLCPKSKVKRIRKCVVSKQTSLVYKVRNKDIYLVSFIANITNHKY